jgi:hypothetical protein
MFAGMRRLLAIAFVSAAAASCGGADSPGDKAAGDTCSASSECGPMLLCDFGQSPPKCSSNSSAPQPDGPSDVDGPVHPPIDGAPDAPAPPDAAVPDAPAPDAAIDAV